MAPGVLRAEGVERIARPLSRSFPQQWGPAGSFPAFSPGCLGDRGTVTTSAGFSRWIPSVPGPASLAEGRRLASADAACGPAPRPGHGRTGSRRPGWRRGAAWPRSLTLPAVSASRPRQDAVLALSCGNSGCPVPLLQAMNACHSDGHKQVARFLLGPHKTLRQNKIHLRATTFWGNVSTVNGNLDVAWMGRREYAGPLRGALGGEDLERGV